MYHPADDGDAEFIELFNTSLSTVPLYDPAAPQRTWQLLGGVMFAFPMGASLAPQSYALVVASDPNAFRAARGISPDTPIYGPYDGKLSNGGERIGLYRPGAPLPGPIVPVIAVDGVEYDDESPWPIGADGLGQALGRKLPLAFGDDVANWQLSTTGGTPGGANVAFDMTPPSVATLSHATFVAANTARLAWSTAADAESGVPYYQVFRDGTLLATTTSTAFDDTAVPPGTTFNYQVRAINGDGVVGPMRSLPSTLPGVRTGQCIPPPATPPPSRTH
jgi:hypothetical protein